jgi:hypothetical protein
MPGLVKIGMTEKHPKERAGQLWTTGVPEGFEVYFAAYSEDAVELESRAHARFYGFRHSENREFFSVHPHTAMRAVIEEHESGQGFQLIEQEYSWKLFELFMRFDAVIPGQMPSDVMSALLHLAPDEFTAIWQRYSRRKEAGC